MGVITVSAVCFSRDGRVLTVRKRGTSMFMLPGGKPEGGETAAACAAREVHEELGVVVDAEALRLVGVFDATAANEAGFTVRATVFAHDGAIEPVVQAELEDARWVDPAQGIDDPQEAPLNREHVFPLLVAARG
ncbi:NUDIX hydrolase [Agrococcus sp. SGAir0287]|uniref:NUDIX hydrolase n=1 Tax=Agrococcus sp. SGAir0287 TaxID=2070347 RepID=UPI0010CCC8B1|nr:NUDIX domain-containing protein [Agrococcus sp. SGAir0287]QCR20360.1 NUDIX hydrolase [Agrococcus sp. SGAir0287]